MQFAATNRSCNSIAEAAVSLICRNHGPVSMSKDSIMAITSLQPRLAHACPAKLNSFLRHLTVLQYISGREGACSRQWLVEESARAPSRRVRVARCDISILGEVRVQFSVLVVSKELVMINIGNGGSRRRYVPLGKEAGLCICFNLRCSRLSTSRVCIGGIFRSGREIEIYSMGVKAS